MILIETPEERRADFFRAFFPRCKIRLQAFRPEKKAFFLEVWKLIDEPISAPFLQLAAKDTARTYNRQGLAGRLSFWKLVAWSKGGRPEKLLIFSGFQTGCRCRRKLLIFFVSAETKSAGRRITAGSVSDPEGKRINAAAGRYCVFFMSFKAWKLSFLVKTARRISGRVFHEIKSLLQILSRARRKKNRAGN